MNHSSAPEYWTLLLGSENLIIFFCYLIIGSVIAYGVWHNRKTCIDPMIIAISAIFFSCSAGHFFHAFGILLQVDILRWKVIIDMTTVIVAICFLSFYKSIDLLSRFSQVAASQIELKIKNEKLEQAMRELKNAQVHLVQNEKMSSLGRLVAGVAHEINNPVNFIYGNIIYIQEYTQKLLRVFQAYQVHYPNPPQTLQAELDDVEVDFIAEDLLKILTSINIGAERIREIVLSLRNFSRLDEAEFKQVDIHEGIDNTLLILQHRLKEKPEFPGIKIVKDYGQLSQVGCYAGQLNQVFMNLLANAIDALEQAYRKQRDTNLSRKNPNTVWISTQMITPDWVRIIIADNGIGMSEEVRSHIFEPFFTTKPIGKGTGLGLSISYQIVVQRHKGKILCDSSPGEGTKFIIDLPVHHPKQIA
jgi:signal transduction histidine kinase